MIAPRMPARHAHACTAGVKVRITRQRMVGSIARHSDADIAAGVTPGHPWPLHEAALIAMKAAQCVPRRLFVFE